MGRPKTISIVSDSPSISQTFNSKDFKITVIVDCANKDIIMLYKVQLLPLNKQIFLEAHSHS